MVSENAVSKIKNLFISTTEKGSQDGRSLHAVYRYLNSVVEDKKNLRYSYRWAFESIYAFAEMKSFINFLIHPTQLT